jgi:1-deoxy-D-xylulose-5-phosphate reductoisomerase
MTEKQSIAIFGSTGSIGTQAVEIIQNQRESFSVSVLTANNNFELLAEQANDLKPEYLLLGNEDHKEDFINSLNYQPKEVFFGNHYLEDLAEQVDYDLLLNSLVGFAGFMSTYTALKRDKKVALANKESLVTGGEILSKMGAFKKGKLIPVDSEHSAMLQSLIGENQKDIQKIIITASGGPFKDYSSQQMKEITVEDALDHPNWDMGAKITIDSSTMMNKGLEIMEAKWFFDVDVDQIVPVIHPQSIIHSIVEFVDGSSKAQLGPPDMKVPILYALSFPNRISYPNKTLDYSERMMLEIRPVNYEQFPCLQLAIDAVKEGGTKPAILNAANEVAVERFLKREIHYIEIPKIIESSLNSITIDKELTPETLMQADKETRAYAYTLL